MNSEKPSTACDEVLLPSNPPSVTVSLELGKMLRKRGKEIHVNFAALNDIMLDRGIPENEFSNISIAIGERFLGDPRGRAGYDVENKSYDVTIYPTILQMHGFRTPRLQKTVVHEMQHVSDYISEDYLHDDERRLSIKKMRGRLGSAALTLGAFLSVPGTLGATIEATRNNSALAVTAQAYPGLASAAVSTYMAAVIMSYPISKAVLYRTDILESRAFSVANKHFDKYPDVIQIVNSHDNKSDHRNGRSLQYIGR